MHSAQETSTAQGIRPRPLRHFAAPYLPPFRRSPAAYSPPVGQQQTYCPLPSSRVSYSSACALSAARAVRPLIVVHLYFAQTKQPASPVRLLMAQDTGAAIKGAVRVDYFWGYGDNAGQTAGKQNYTGYVWMLLPHGVMPSYRP